MYDFAREGDLTLDWNWLVSGEISGDSTFLVVENQVCNWEADELSNWKRCYWPLLCRLPSFTLQGLTTAALFHAICNMWVWGGVGLGIELGWNLLCHILQKPLL